MILNKRYFGVYVSIYIRLISYYLLVRSPARHWPHSDEEGVNYHV